LAHNTEYHSTRPTLGRENKKGDTLAIPTFQKPSTRESEERKMPGKSEHEYLDWKIRITDKPVESQFSARIEVWKPEDDPRSHTGLIVPFLKRAVSLAKVQDTDLETAKKWIDQQVA
jgi:hypothetical protein